MECKEISTIELNQFLFSRQKIQLVDVREIDEYRDGHLEGSQLIPLGTLPYRTYELDPYRPVVLICRSGNRSKEACQYWICASDARNTSRLGRWYVAC